MADINFNFNAENLDELKKLLEQLNKIAKEIQANIAKVGKVTEDDSLRAKKLAAETLKVENAIKRQEMAQANLNQKQKESQGIIGGLEAEVRRLRSAYKAAQDEASKETARKELEKVNKKLVEAKGNTNTWSKALGSFQFKFNALGNIAANVLNKMTQGAKEFLSESLKMGLQVEGIRAAFEKLGRPNLLSDLRKATRGAVNDLELMRAAVQANNFRIPLDRFATFLKFAGDRAIQTGEDFNYLVESIVKGLGRKSVLILDNLGLSVSEINEEVRRTGDFMTAAANIIEKEMKKSGEVADTTATTVANMRTQFQNLQILVGEKLTPVIDLLGKSFEGLSMAIGGKRGEGIRDAEKAFDALLGNAKKRGLTEVEIAEQARKQIDINTQTLEKLNMALDWDKDEKRIAYFTKLNELWAQQVNVITKTIKPIREFNDEFDAGLIKQLEQGIADDLSAFNKELQTTQSIFSKAFQMPEGALSGAELDLFIEAQKAIEQGFTEFLAAEQEKRTDKQKEQYQIEADNFAEKERKKEEVAKSTFGTLSGIINSLSSLYESNKQKELSAAGDNAEKREEIERKYARKQQTIAIAESIIGAAQGGVETFKKLGFPLAIPFIAAGAAFSLAQIATIKAQKFAEGGEIGGKLHSQGGTMIEAEKGEFVINRRSTAKHKRLIEGINEDNQMKILASLRLDKALPIQSESKYLKKIYDHLQAQESGYETPGFYVIKKGSKTTKLAKHG